MLVQDQIRTTEDEIFKLCQATPDAATTKMRYARYIGFLEANLDRFLAVGTESELKSFQNTLDDFKKSLENTR